MDIMDPGPGPFQQGLGDDPGSWEICFKCNFQFETVEDARDHFAVSCTNLWCRRCDKAYKSRAAIEEHFAKSFKHWKCGECSYDGYNVEGQERHWRKTGHRYECMGCHSWFERMFWEQHMRYSHACVRCHKHFRDDWHKHQHERTHEHEPLHVCVGRCGKAFPTIGGMFIHLESGACDSGINFRDIFKTFAVHPAADLLIDLDRKAALVPMITGEDPQVCPFVCPGSQGNSCGEVFKYFSGFLQHADSARCGFRFNKTGDQAMLTHMEKNLFLDATIARVEKLEQNTRKGFQLVIVKPERRRNRVDAYVPKAEDFHPFLGEVIKYLRLCLRGLSWNSSQSNNAVASLSIRGSTFPRDLTQLHRAHDLASGYHAGLMENQQIPHCEIVVVFHHTQTSQTVVKLLKDIGKLARTLKVAYDYSKRPEGGEGG